MTIKRIALSVLALGMLLATGAAFAGKSISLPAALWGPDLFQELRSKGSDEFVFEFRQGDRLPLSVRVEGDLLETADNNPVPLTVKRSFFIKINSDGVLMSLDGLDYHPMEELVTKSGTAGITMDERDQVVNGLSLLFKGKLRQ